VLGGRESGFQWMCLRRGPGLRPGEKTGDLDGFKSEAKKVATETCWGIARDGNGVMTRY